VRAAAWPARNAKVYCREQLLQPSPRYEAITIESQVDPGRATSPGSALRSILARPEPLVLPGCSDALSARLAEQAGFEAVYATGAGIANTMLGVPDVGLTTMTELAEQVARIASAVAVPVVADIDTGFGNAINARRAVAEFERAGVAAIQIEDQVFPKRCGHFNDKQIVPLPEFLAKLRAVLEARRDPGLVVIARTDALAVDGYEAAIERGRAFAEAGADVVFIEAPTELDQLAALPGRIAAPLLINMVEGGRTPLLGATELGAMGYRIVLFANTAMRVGALAVRDAFTELRATGDSRGLQDRMLSWDDRQALVGLPEIEALEARYRSE
jgi:2-methylisocitrate lyase-like PEP mutase family enzyme